MTKHRYKFFIDRGEQKNREDLVSGFDFECEAVDRYEAQGILLRAKDRELQRWDTGDGVVVMMSCNDKYWHRVCFTQPPTIYTLKYIEPVPIETVHAHFEVDL